MTDPSRAMVDGYSHGSIQINLVLVLSFPLSLSE